jgi:malate dehydrogenase
VDIAVLGASGDVGRQLCTQLILDQVMTSTSRLQLVGRSDGASGRAVLGLAADLADAFSETMPVVEVVLDPREIAADIVIVAAGATIPADGTVRRDELAAANFEIFRSYAEGLARYGNGHETVVVVTNPVELGVAVFAERLGRHRVVGMGAWVDTLRFLREIADSLGVGRQQVSGFVVGQHGDDVVPLWSTVQVQGASIDRWTDKVRALRGERTLASFPAEMAEARNRLFTIARNDLRRAFRLLDDLPPDLRAALRPLLIQNSRAKTAAGTASATTELVEYLVRGTEIVVPLQVALDREVHDLVGVMGVPVVLGAGGWHQVALPDLLSDETQRFLESAVAIEKSLAPWVISHSFSS